MTVRYLPQKQAHRALSLQASRDMKCIAAQPASRSLFQRLSLVDPQVQVCPAGERSRTIRTRNTRVCACVRADCCTHPAEQLAIRVLPKTFLHICEFPQSSTKLCTRHIRSKNDFPLNFHKLSAEFLHSGIAVCRAWGWSPRMAECAVILICSM